MVINSMSYAKYDSYKDSGVDWLGEIPSDWDLVPLRAIFRFRNEKNNPIGNSPAPYSRLPRR